MIKDFARGLFTAGLAGVHWWRLKTHTEGSHGSFLTFFDFCIHINQKEIFYCLCFGKCQKNLREDEENGVDWCCHFFLYVKDGHSHGGGCNVSPSNCMQTDDSNLLFICPYIVTDGYITQVLSGQPYSKIWWYGSALGASCPSMCIHGKAKAPPCAAMHQHVNVIQYNTSCKNKLSKHASIQKPSLACSVSTNILLLLPLGVGGFYRA